VTTKTVIFSRQISSERGREIRRSGMKWEYQLAVLGLDDPKEAKDTLCGFGRDGWELVVITSVVLGISRH
jgi:hypothetical protein